VEQRVTALEAFDTLDIRTGTVISAEPLAGARKPAYKLFIDFGTPIGIKQSSVQITVRYTAPSLVGKQVLAIVNFPPKRVAGFQSEVLVLGVPDDAGAVVLVGPDDAVANGAKLF
jgi:tRNA-binding protein